MSDKDMTPERWRNIGEFFEQALERDPQERRAFLDSACGEDASLRDEVLLLIRHHEATGSRLDHSPLPLQARRDERWLGQTLGHFRIIEPVGRGGQGQVYLAEDLRLHRQVALKLLPDDMSKNSVARRRLLQEAQAAARLDHPYACSIFEVGEEKGIRFIAMELVRGETLRHRLSKGGVPMAEALRWGLEIAEALDAAHRQGLVHRDLKPSNLMVTPSGHIKVMDFGLAKRVGLEGDLESGSLAQSLTEQGTTPGTIAYMSPEQLRGEPVDARSDVFALGLVLFELLSGFHPFGRGSPMETAGAILHDPPPNLSESLPDCPPLLNSTIEEMLTKDAPRRLPSARIAADRLSRLLRISEASSPPARLAGRPTRPTDSGSRQEPGTGIRALASVRWTAVGLAALIAVSLLSYWILQAFILRPGEPTRVAVLSPEISGSADPAVLDSVPFAVLEATLNALTSLRGIEAFDPKRFGSTTAGPARIETEMAVDEVLESRIVCGPLNCQVSLRRLRHGRVLRVSPILSWSARPEDTLNGADAVGAHLRRLYSEFEALGPQLRVEPKDYRDYLRLKRKRERGEVLNDEELGLLENITETSPQWLPAYLLAAEAAKALNRIDRGLRSLRQAERLFPDDPRPLYFRFQLEATSNRLMEAEDTLSKLEEILPGDERALKARRLLLDKRGRLSEARDLAARIVERWPSWRNLFDLAILERRLGGTEAARLHLRRLLDRSPDNTYGLSALAGLETKSGDLSEAERLYRRLVEKQGLAEDRGSLCLVLYLRGRFEEAVRECEQALELRPEDDSDYSLNLALAADAAGDTERARAIYAKLERHLDEVGDSPEGLGPRQSIIKAHCLAKLDDPQKALEWTRRALTPDAEAWVVYDAALVYAMLHPQLTDEREIIKAHLLTRTEQALREGYARHWFQVPGFHAFQNDPSFRSLLAGR